jgi:hypothetical protein
MRRTYYLVFILLLIAQTSFGQIYQNMAQPGYKFSRARFDSVLTIPTGLGNLKNITGGQDTGQIRFNLSDSSVYVWNGRAWIKPVGGGVTVSSYGKNATADSTILLLSNGTRYAAKDSVGGVPTLPFTEIAFGDASNLLTSSPNLTFNNGLFQLGSDDDDMVIAADLSNAAVILGDLSNRFTQTRLALRPTNNTLALFNNNNNTKFAINKETPTATLDVVGSDTSVLKLEGLTNASLATDSMLVIGANGNVKKAIKPVTVSSYGKNATADSTILLLSNGTRYAAKDSVGGGSSGWGLTGNASAVTDFLGTTNNRTMRFRTNNVERMVIDSTGKVAIAGNTTIANLIDPDNILTLQNSINTATNSIRFLNPNNTSQAGLVGTGSNFNYGTYQGNQAVLTGGSGGIGLRVGNGANQHIRFYATNSDADFSTVQLQMFSNTGNVLLQNGGTYTDAGFKFDVNGTTRLQNNLTISGSNIAYSPT